MVIICQLHEAGWRLSVRCMRYDDGYLSVTCGRMTVICELHEQRWPLSVSYMRQFSVYQTATWGSMTFICYMRHVYGYLSVTWGMCTVICQLHEAGWLLSVNYMRQDFGTALITILPIWFQYCYKDCYSDSRNLWAIMKWEVWRLTILFSRLFL